MLSQCLHQLLIESIKCAEASFKQVEELRWHGLIFVNQKKEGSLGLRNCNIWNKALLLKIFWDLMNAKDTLWIKWVHAYYLKKKNVWTWKCGHDDPPLFIKLEKIKKCSS